MATERFRNMLKQKADDAASLGVIQTSLEEVQLVKLTRPVARTSAMLIPGLCLAAQGRKNIYLGERKYVYDEGSFLLGGCKIPVSAELEDASDDRPYYGMAIFLNSKIVSELLLDFDRVNARASLERPEGLLVRAALSEQLQDSICRLLSILGDKNDEAILAPALLREIYYVVLKSEAGEYLKNAAFQHGRAHRVAPLIHYLEEHIQGDVTIAQLSKFSGMSSSALHDSFKEATKLSPMQYLKRLRLNHAHKLLMMGQTVNAAATGSGYNSASQFSREFRRLFGFSPKEVVTVRRD